MKAKNGELELAPLDDRILLTAADHVGFVLRPYPKAEPEEMDAAIARLRQKGLVHGSQREPNLSAAGIIAVRELQKQAA